MLKIYDNTSCLFQWDLNRKLAVLSDDINEVHFSNVNSNKALICTVYEEDNTRVVDIPNILLQDCCAVHAYAVCNDQVKSYKVFTICKRQKPEDYIYTETEVLSFRELDASMKQALKDAKEAAERAEAAADIASDTLQSALSDIERAKDAALTEIEGSNTGTSNCVVRNAAEGKSILINDSSNSYFNDLRVYGKTEQATTTGKNLFNPDNVLIGFFGSNGDFSESTACRTVYIECLPNTIYTISKIKGTRFGAGYSDTLPTQSVTGLIRGGASNNSGNTITITTDNTAKYLLAYIYNANSDTDITAEEVLATVQIEQGSTATPYEKYTGGKASPNTDYPQELINAADDGELKVNVLGKNLLDIPDTTLTGLGYLCRNKPISLPLGIYTFSCKHDIPTKNVGWWVNLYDADLVKVAGSGTLTGTKNSAVLQVSKTPYYISIYINGAATMTNIQLELGDTATPYTPYKQPQTITSSINGGLCGIPVTSGGNYTDANGQMWICDEIDLEQGVYIKRIKNCVLNGKEKWRKETSSSGAFVFITTLADVEQIANSDRILCTHYHASVGNAYYNKQSACYLFNATLRIYHEGIDNVDDYKAYLSSNPIEIVYILAEPTRIKLTEAELEAFKQLKTNYPITTVLNDSNAYMQVEYNADTKLYIDNKFAQLQAAIVNSL